MFQYKVRHCHLHREGPSKKAKLITEYRYQNKFNLPK